MNTGPTLKIYTLGALRIEYGNGPLSGLMTQKVKALLVYLACNPGAQARSQLAEMFWQDLPPERVSANLRTALSNLQQHLRPFLVISRYHASIDPTSCMWVDMLELDNYLTTFETQQQTLEIESYLGRQLVHVLDLYESGFLQQFTLRDAPLFQEWVNGTQQRLQQRVLSALQALAESGMRRRHYLETVPIAQRLAQLDPHNIGHRAKLTSVLTRAGQHEAALEQLKHLRRDFVGKENVQSLTAIEDTYYKDVARGSRHPLPDSLFHNTPASSIPFISRAALLSQISELLSLSECRLVTLVGMAGTGKSRLAWQAAQDERLYFTDGVCFLPLAQVGEGRNVLALLAESMNIALDPAQDPAVQLVRYLADKALLLVVDDCECALAEAAALVDLLGTAPYVKILATSRVSLSVYGEWLVQVDGMAYPDQAVDNWRNYEAVQFLITALRRTKPDFDPEMHRDAILTLCDLTTGIPLFLELAASWSDVINLEQLTHRAATDLDHFSTTLELLPVRQRSLRTIFEKVWSILASDERQLLRRLAVFDGSFSRDAAEKVACATTELMAAFLNKGLVRLVDNGFKLQPQFRQFCYEQLEDAREAGCTRDAHLYYYLTLVENTIREKLDAAAISQTAHEDENIHQAVTWACQSGNVEAVQRFGVAGHHQIGVR